MIGCSHIEPYPFEKRQVAEYQKGVCPNIEGKYYELGEGKNNSNCIMSGDPNDNSCSFSRLLFEDRIETEKTVYLHINQSEKDKLIITIENEEGILHQVKLDKNNGEYTCKQEGLVIPQIYFHIDGTGVASGTEKYILNPLNENYLLVKRVSKFSALGFFLFPFSGTDESWFRWARVNNENP